EVDEHREDALVLAVFGPIVMRLELLPRAVPQYLQRLAVFCRCVTGGGDPPVERMDRRVLGDPHEAGDLAGADLGDQLPAVAAADVPDGCRLKGWLRAIDQESALVGSE